MFAKEGTLCLRHAKRGNMERLTLACGGSPVHSVEDLDASQLGWAGRVSEVSLGDDKAGISPAGSPSPVSPRRRRLAASLSS